MIFLYARRACLTSSAALLAMGCWLVLPERLAAQTTGDADAGLGEVVVTAQRVKEDVQGTPIAISVYSAEALKTAGITNMAALSATAPDVSFATTEGQSIITIRGISSRDTTETGDPAVSV